MKLYSPSKLNLGLRIVGRRSDGYHLLESIFWPVSLVDELTISSHSSNVVEISWAKDASITNQELPLAKDNLVTRLLNENPELGKWKVHIKKRIPIGGGLGGSSSNVGTLLKYFIAEKIISMDRANTIGILLGADVPYFLNPVPCFVQGIGEVVAPLSVTHTQRRSFGAWLFFPPFGCDTKNAFRQFKNLQIPFSKSEGAPRLDAFQNDLEQINPELSPLLKDLHTLPGVFALMSGSGSTCFAASFEPGALDKNAKAVEEICRKHHCRSIRVSTFEMYAK